MLLQYIHWNPSPFILEIGSFEFRWYSLLFAAGFFIGFFLVKSMLEREKEPKEWLDKLLFYIFFGAVIGARLGHCIFYDWDYYSDHILEMILPVEFEPTFRFIGFRGLASHGGAIGIIIALLLFNYRVAKKHWLWVFDRVVVAIPLAGGFIRLGNLMNSEIVGNETTVPWAFIFERVDELPRHPVQLYESLGYFALFFLLWYLYWKTDTSRYIGRIFGIFLIFLWGSRFILEYFKRSQGGLQEAINNGLSTGQLLSIPFIIFGLFLLWFYRNKKYPNLRY